MFRMSLYMAPEMNAYSQTNLIPNLAVSDDDNDDDDDDVMYSHAFQLCIVSHWQSHFKIFV